MEKINWFLGSDHRGYALRKYLATWLEEQGCKVVDLGPDSPERSDAPLKMDEMVQAIQQHPNAYGLFICGTGGNPSVRANRYMGIRAILAVTPRQAEFGVSHGNSNILCLGADVTPTATAIEILNTFLKTNFNTQDPAYLRRIEQLDAPLK